MFTLAAVLIRNGPFLLFAILPLLLISMGLGSFVWAAITYGVSVHLLPGLGLFLLGKGLARLGGRPHRTEAAASTFTQ